MNVKEIWPPPNRRGGQIETSIPGGNDALIAPGSAPTQAEIFGDFDPEIAIALAASGWRATSALLLHAGRCIEAGDLLGAEYNRQKARGLFIETNDRFRSLQEALRREGIMSEARR